MSPELGAEVIENNENEDEGEWPGGVKVAECGGREEQKCLRMAAANDKHGLLSQRRKLERLECAINA
jgi:hypothetical protein